ncbi:MAG: hypothetical protein JWM31_3659 [Solirubrobacterales bacterium]|nr:hypothetical protein [Solirubrobacterales bacterium]
MIHQEHETAAPEDVGTDEVIRRAMDAARELTGLQLAYVAEFLEGKQYLRVMDGDASGIGLELHAPLALEESFCQRMVDGRLANLVPDTAANPVTEALAVRTDAGLGAYVGVPLRLPDGSLFGSFCCVSPAAEPALSERHVDLLRMFARLVGDQIGQSRQATAVQRAQGEFLASVSHDLRSPLIAVQHLAEDLAVRHADVDPAEAGVLIERETRRVLSMVEDMMLVTRQRAGQLTLEVAPADLADLAASAARSVALAAGPGGERVKTELPAAPLMATLDEKRVAQALQNLLENAVKYSPGGGPVTLRLRADGPTAVLEVEDEGIGVSVEDQAHLGERFFRASTAAERGIPGIGLGLATVQAVAALHEGTLVVESRPGVGSTFSLRLPLDANRNR